MDSQLFFLEIKENPHLVLAESCGSGSGCTSWLRNDSLSLCSFIKRLNQTLPVVPLAIENGLGILFRTAKLLTYSMVQSPS